MLKINPKICLVTLFLLVFAQKINTAIIATCSGKSIKIWDTDKPKGKKLVKEIKTEFSLDDNRLPVMKFHPTKTNLLFYLDRGILYVFDIEKGEVIKNITIKNEFIDSFKFNPAYRKEKEVFIISEETLYALNWVEGKVVQKINTRFKFKGEDYRFSKFDFFPKIPEFLVVVSAESLAKGLGVLNWKKLKLLSWKTPLTGDEDENIFVQGMFEGTTYSLHAFKLNPIKLGIVAIGYASYDSNRIDFWDLQQTKKVLSKNEIEWKSFLFHPKKENIFIVSKQLVGDIQVFSSKDWKKLNPIMTLKHPSSAKLLFNPEGTHLFSYGGGLVRIWDISKEKGKRLIKEIKVVKKTSDDEIPYFEMAIQPKGSEEEKEFKKKLLKKIKGKKPYVDVIIKLEK
ncbi:hypothetical protein ACFLYU_01175 [Candidatus Dependentiae bacterium]